METIVNTAPAAPLSGAAGAVTTFRSGRSGRAGALARSAPLRRAVRLLFFALQGALVGVLLLVAAATLPVFVGYHNYIVFGGSMGDSLPNGSIAVTKAVDSASLQVGDIIAVEREGVDGGVLHRIISIEVENGQRVGTTQGDANETPDPEPVILSGDGDKVIYTIPYAGYLLDYTSGRLWQFALIGAPLVLLAGILLREAWRTPVGAASSVDRSVAAANGSPRPDPSPAPKAEVRPELAAVLRAMPVADTVGRSWYETPGLLPLPLDVAVRVATAEAAARSAVVSRSDLDIPGRERRSWYEIPGLLPAPLDVAVRLSRSEGQGLAGLRPEREAKDGASVEVAA